MADLKEILNSRSGAVKGQDASDEYMIIRVLMDESDYTELSPGTRILNDPRGIVADKYPWGTPHPWEPWALARRYHVVDQIAPLHFHVRIDYVRQTVPYWGPTDDWLISRRGTSISLHLLEAHEWVGLDVPTTKPVRPRPGGASGLDIAGSVAGILTPEPTAIGMPQYLPVNEESPDALYYTYTYPKGIKTKTWLRVTDATDGAGVDVELPGLLVTFKRVAPNDTVSSEDITRYLKAVNRNAFRGGPAYHIRCDDVVIEPIEMELVDQNVQGRAFAITVTFVQSYLPLAPYQQVCVYRDDQGYETRVRYRATDKVVSKAWEVPPAPADFENLLSLLASS